MNIFSQAEIIKLSDTRLILAALDYHSGLHFYDFKNNYEKLPLSIEVQESSIFRIQKSDITQQYSIFIDANNG